MVTRAAHDHLPLAGVGAHRVDAVETRAAGLPQGATLVNVWRSREEEEEKRGWMEKAKRFQGEKGRKKGEMRRIKKKNEMEERGENQ